MVVTLTLNPAVDCTLRVRERLRLGAVHKVETETRTPGGKGVNVAKVLAANDRAVIAGGLLGQAEVDAFRDFLSDLGIESAFLAVPYPTRENVMAVDGGGRELKLNRPGFPGLAFDWPRLAAYGRELIGHGDVIVMSGSLPARFPAYTYARLVRWFTDSGMSVVLDTSGEALALALPEGPAVLKPNRAELAAVLGVDLANETGIAGELRKLAARHDVVIMSDGAAGAYLAGGDCVYHGAPPRVRVKDTTGAGDSLLGQFCADYFFVPERRLDTRIVARAVAAGAACVEKDGTPPLDLQRVEQLAAAVKVREL